jgi:2-keto-4-pentenoate hydratase
MRMRGAVFCCLILIPTLLVGIAWAGEEEVIVSIVDARASVKAFPLPSSRLPDLNIDKAYGLQRKLVEAMNAKGDAVVGFKAGLTSEKTQKRFGVSHPLLGAMFKSGELPPGATVDPKSFVRLFVENEIGYVVGREINGPVKDVAALKGIIDKVFPAVELPDLRFADMKNLKPADIVIDAVGSAKFMVGPKVPADGVDLTKVQVTMTRNGETVNNGKAGDVMGDPWKGLLWLVNAVVEKGWTIKPGQILITGAMGKMIPGRPGTYQGDYGALGKLSFTVK